MSTTDDINRNVHAVLSNYTAEEFDAWRREYFGCPDCHQLAGEGHTPLCGWWDGITLRLFDAISQRQEGFPRLELLSAVQRRHYAEQLGALMREPRT